MKYLCLEVVWEKHPLYGAEFGQWTDFLCPTDGDFDAALIDRLKRLGAEVWGHADTELIEAGSQAFICPRVRL